MRVPKALGIMLFAAAAGLAAASPARAGVRITLHNGLVSLVAVDATVGQILNEWAKVGQTTIVNGERVGGGTLTLQLTDVPEEQALDTLLQALGGYVAVQRARPVAGLSRFDRIVVIATGAAPVSGAASTTARSSLPQPIDPATEASEDALPGPFVREDYPADDEVNWTRGPEPVPQPPPGPLVREDYPAEDEVNWNPLLANGGVPRPPSTPNGRSTGQGPLVVPLDRGPAVSPRGNPGMPTVPAGVPVPGMPTPVPRLPTQQTVSPDL